MTASNIISTMGVLLFTITLIWGIAWLAMRFKLVPGQKTGRSKNSASELAIVETLTLDTKRRLVKVEDNGMEHLFLLGPTNEIHVQSKDINLKDKTNPAGSAVKNIAGSSEKTISKNSETIPTSNQNKDKPLH